MLLGRGLGHDWGAGWDTTGRGLGHDLQGKYQLVNLSTLDPSPLT
jgi:hypothetical protein